MVTRAGLLRHFVTIQSKTTTTDAQGGRSSSFSTLLSRVAARVQAKTGNELLQSKAIGSEVQYLVTIRALGAAAAVGPSMRVIWHAATDVTLEIHGVIPSEAGDALVLNCGAVS